MGGGGEGGMLRHERQLLYFYNPRRVRMIWQRDRDLAGENKTLNGPEVAETMRRRNKRLNSGLQQ